MRLYVPLSAADVDQLSAAGDVTPPAAFAVTAQLADLLPDADTEEHEHLATQLAAAACGEARIIVGVFDSATAVTPGETTGLVRPDAALPVRELVCLLVGDEGAQVTEDADVELSWYDRTELALVRDLVG